MIFIVMDGNNIFLDKTEGLVYTILDFTDEDSAKLYIELKR